MALIDENQAWEILHRYAQDCLRIDAGSLLAVFAIGSLGGGYYRPGQSDIDAVLIVRDGSERFWGHCSHSEELSEPLAALNRRYLETYQIPKDFGPFPLQERDLYPPYNPEQALVALEIARLKVQGKCVYGAYDLTPVPMPTPADFLRDAQRFEEWWRDEGSKGTPLESRSLTACVNSTLMHLGRFLRIKRGVIEFDKRQVVRAYLDNDPPFADEDILHSVEIAVAGGHLLPTEEDRLRRYVGRVRTLMNECLGIEV